MRLRSKISILTGVVFLGALLIMGLSIWTMRETARLRDTIESGSQLIASASRLHGLMKDLLFDLFTPQTYLLLKDVLHTPRSQTTRNDFRAAMVEFESATSRFMESPRVKALLRETELRDAYQIAGTMISKASKRIGSFQRKIDSLFEAGVGGEGSLYHQLQTEGDPSIPLFFDEARETSYYLTYSFESFLSHFISSLRQESDLIRRQILILFWTLTAVIGTATVTLSIGFARRISLRIKIVEEGFRRVSHGDFTARLDVRSTDELGALAASFNLFMTDLKRNVDSIQSLMRDVGQSITDRPSFERILELIVEAAVKDSHAGGAAVIAADPEGRPAVARSAGAFPYPAGEPVPIAGRAPAAAASPAKAIVLHEIFERKETVFVREARSLDAAGTVGSFLALPLCVSQGMVGMLCIVTGENEPPLTDLDYTNFRTFAEHAGLIIDNYYKYRELLTKREAEYRALQSQIQPHFLYNVLNGLIGLNRMGDAQSLEKAILSLKDMLRYILDAGNWTTIGEEFRFLERYLELQGMRFAERLSAECLLDPQAAPFRIPKLILQPLVENAVIHGIEPLDRPGKLTVEAHVIRSNGSTTLGISVVDDGIGISADGQGEDRGIGLANVRERLLTAYPGARLEVTGAPGQGTRVSMEIPIGGGQA